MPSKCFSQNSYVSNEIQTPGEGEFITREGEFIAREPRGKGSLLLVKSYRLLRARRSVGAHLESFT